MHRGISVLTDPDRWIWFVSRARTAIPRNLNVIIMTYTEHRISRYVPARFVTAGRSVVDSEQTAVGAIEGVNVNRKTTRRFVPNFLVTLAGCYSREMKTNLPRNYVLIICCAACWDVDIVVFSDITPIGVTVRLGSQQARSADESVIAGACSPLVGPC